MNQPAASPIEPASPDPSYALRIAQGVALAGDPRQKSPFLAGVLSLMPGLGQVYVGYYRRGFVHAATIAGLITLLSSGDLDELTPMFAIFMAFFWLYNIVDASRRAALFNQVLAGGTDIELPRDLDLPGLRGSLFGGLTLAAAGFVLLLHTRFDVSLAWLGEWWPAGLILFGLYLAVRARMEADPAPTADSDSI